MEYEFKEIADPSYKAAKIIVPLILNIFPSTNNVVDLGGGLGQWCKAFKDKGIKEILCIDHPSVNINDLLINENEFLAVNLESKLPRLSRKFDLGLSLEFAEHINERYNEEIVKYLTALSDIIIFSAAIPKQGGIKHINEKRLKYWVHLFKQNGYDYLDILRPLIINQHSIPFYYRQNLSVFINQNISSKFYQNKQFNIDPSEFEIVALKILERKIGIREAVKLLKNALVRYLKNH